ncbi:MAG: phosphoribosylamine--glycine ligase [Candidatus Limnocylindrales bacterium]
MRIMVVGSGAREHALCWRLSQEGAERVIVAPGNPLMSDAADVRGDVSASDFDAIVALATAEKVDLVAVGPEAPLAEGLADRITAAGIPCFGPTAAAARIEASKSFAREICRAASVPMALGASFESVVPALEYARMLGLPVVIKADGLAAGKGVAICASLAEAEAGIREALEGGRFGASGQKVVIEQWLEGVEASVIAICDGRDALILPTARDHKRLLAGDQGPNTGGMGAFSPIGELDSAALRALHADLFLAVLCEMESRDAPFRGALFCGLMLTPDGPRVLEFNARFGDPETQAILPRLDQPFTPLLMASASGLFSGVVLNDAILGATEDTTVALTLAADGYPNSARLGDPIDGIEAARSTGALVFGAGVRLGAAGELITAGGRVLTVVGRGPGLAAAADSAYEAADMINFIGKQVRRDIGRSLAGIPA